MGAKEAAAGMGAALGPLIGGLVFEHVAQTAAFVLNGALLLVTAALACYWFVFKPSTSDKTQSLGS